LYEPRCFTTNSPVTTLNLTCLLFGFTVCNLCTCRFHLELSSSWSCAIVLAPINIGFNLCGAFTYQNELHRHKASDSIVMTQHYTSEHSFLAVKQELSLYKFRSARHPIACIFYSIALLTKHNCFVSFSSGHIILLLVHTN
jgi:hypothetical protein